MFGTGARLFHWTIALLLVVQIPAGIAMTSEPLAAWADPLFILHKGLGVVLVVVVLGRVGWRVTHPPPPFPPFMSAREQRIARATHLSLYALLVVMAVSGYVRTVGDRYPIDLLNVLGIPTLLPLMPEVAAFMLVVHRFTVFALLMLAAAHVAAVVQRHWIDGHPVMDRMWPPIRPKEDDVP